MADKRHNPENPYEMTNRKEAAPMPANEPLDGSKSVKNNVRHNDNHAPSEGS